VSSQRDEVDDKHSPSPSQLDGERDGGREGGRESLLMCHTVFAEAETLMTDIGYASSLLMCHTVFAEEEKSTTDILPLRDSKTPLQKNVDAANPKVKAVLHIHLRTACLVIH
jgi:hypothetical protein